MIAKATDDDAVVRFRSVGEYLAAVGTALGMEAGRVTAQPLEASYPYWRQRVAAGLIRVIDPRLTRRARLDAQVRLGRC